MSAVQSKPAHIKALAIVVMVFGALFAVAGTGTWIAVSSNLRAEQITVSEDAAAFGGAIVDTRGRRGRRPTSSTTTRSTRRAARPTRSSTARTRSARP